MACKRSGRNQAPSLCYGLKADELAVKTPIRLCIVGTESHLTDIFEMLFPCIKNESPAVFWAEVVAF